MTSPDGLTTLFTALGALAAVAAAIYTKHSVERARAAAAIAEAALRYQVLLPLAQEYRSPAMLYAVRTLWSFARENSSNLAHAYTLQLKKDEAAIQALEPTQRIEHLAMTLDNQRRTVSQLYQFLAALSDEGGHLRKVIYGYWVRSDLQIIPDVLIPMELALGADMADPASRFILDRLRRLYNNCPLMS